jgi:hypothetical protein
MKKLVLTSAFALAVTGAAFAQGVIEWNGIGFADFTAQTNTTVSSFVSAGGSKALTGGVVGNTVAGAAGSFYYELLYSTSSSTAPTTLAALDSWVDTGLEGESSSASVAGRAMIPTASQQTAVTVPFSTATSMMLVGWSANLGTTWSAASTVLNSVNALASVVGTPFFGESSIGTVTPLAPGTNPGQNVFGAPGIVSTLTQLDEVTAVPEPTTLALGAMGALSLLALRRKKA